MDWARNVEELCMIVELQNEIIKRLSDRLAQLDALEISDQEEIHSVEIAVHALIGDAR